MSFYFLDEYFGEKEVIIGDESIIIKYQDEHEIKNINIRHEYIKNISFSCKVDHYIFDVATDTIVVTFSLSIDNRIKIREWLKIYKDIMINLSKYYSIDEIKHRYVKNKSLEFIGDEFYIEIVPSKLEEKSKVSLYIISTLIIILILILINLIL